MTLSVRKEAVNSPSPTDMTVSPVTIPFPGVPPLTGLCLCNLLSPVGEKRDETTVIAEYYGVRLSDCGTPPRTFIESSQSLCPACCEAVPHGHLARVLGRLPALNEPALDGALCKSRLRHELVCAICGGGACGGRLLLGWCGCAIAMERVYADLF